MGSVLLGEASYAVWLGRGGWLRFAPVPAEWRLYIQGAVVISETKAPLVVVLEDDQQSADALAGILVDWGYECVHGETLDAVLPAMRDRSGEVRAIISDYHLADGVTGVEAVRAAAELGIRAPVLLLTGTLRGAARRVAQAAGFQFMEKPVAPERLQSWLQQMVVDRSD